jgi:hypothetical protein
MDALDFDEDDLAANRAGCLSQPQMMKLRRKFENEMKQIAAVGIVIIFVTVIAGRELPTTWGCMILFNFGFAGLCGLWCYRFWSDLNQGEAHSIEGCISLYLSSRDSRGGFTVTLQGKTWPVAKDTFLAFKNGDP